MYLVNFFRCTVSMYFHVLHKPKAKVPATFSTHDLKIFLRNVQLSIFSGQIKLVLLSECLMKKKKPRPAKQVTKNLVFYCVTVAKLRSSYLPEKNMHRYSNIYSRDFSSTAGTLIFRSYKARMCKYLRFRYGECADKISCRHILPSIDNISKKK